MLCFLLALVSRLYHALWWGLPSRWVTLKADSSQVPYRSWRCYVHPQNTFIERKDVECTFWSCRVKSKIWYPYCSPRIPLDDETLSLNFQLSENKVIPGDLNGHHRQCGSMRSDARGEQIKKLLVQTKLCFLNDDSLTRVYGQSGNASAIYLSISSAPGKSSMIHMSVII